MAASEHLGDSQDLEESIHGQQASVLYRSVYKVNEATQRAALEVTDIPLLGGPPDTPGGTVPTSILGGGIQQVVVTCTRRRAQRIGEGTGWCRVECEFERPTIGGITWGYQGIEFEIGAQVERRTRTIDGKRYEQNVSMPYVVMRIFVRRILAGGLGLSSIIPNAEHINDNPWGLADRGQWLFMGAGVTPAGINIYDLAFEFHGTTRRGGWNEEITVYDPQDDASIIATNVKQQNYLEADFDTIIPVPEQPQWADLI